MQILEIPIGQIRDFLEKQFFNNNYSKPFNFLPTELCEWAHESYYLINTKSIKKWNDFEYSKIYLDETDFKSIVFGRNTYLPDSTIYFISDDSLKIKSGFEFVLKDYELFVAFYEKKFEGSFFQPLDYVVILKEYLDIKIIFHEGKLISISAQ